MTTKNFLILVGSILVVLFILLGFAVKAEFGSDDEVAEVSEEQAQEKNTEKQEEKAKENVATINRPELKLREGNLYNAENNSVFEYQSGVDIPYPDDGVKGIYVTAFSAGGDRMQSLIDLVNNTALNSMVIDVKEDVGDIMMPLDSENDTAKSHMQDYIDGENLLNQMEENEIYPIGRIVVFKDTRLANDRPDLSFLNSDGTVWQNGNGESFVNPFLKEVWDYNIDIAIEAAKLGFKEIQFDYVRFPEAFETMSGELEYDLGEYDAEGADEIQNLSLH